MDPQIASLCNAMCCAMCDISITVRAGAGAGYDEQINFGLLWQNTH